MTIPDAPAGYTRFVMKSKFGAGRDFRILDPDTEAELFIVDGKMGPRPRADITELDGTLLYQVTGKILGIPKRMDVTTADGDQVAHLHAKPFQFVKDKIEVTLATGEELLMTGNIIEKDYALSDASGRTVLQITQKWIAVRDRYTVDVAEGVDAGMAFALVWAIDRWVERD